MQDVNISSRLAALSANPKLRKSQSTLQGWVKHYYPHIINKVAEAQRS